MFMVSCSNPPAPVKKREPATPTKRETAEFTEPFISSLNVKTILENKDKTITVRGKVFSVFDAPSGKVINLNMGPNYKGCFKAVIFQGSYSKWPNEKDDLKSLSGKTIKVCGIVKEYNGLPQIIINSPTQIQLE
jgi:hypothetical protein